LFWSISFVFATTAAAASQPGCIEAPAGITASFHFDEPLFSKAPKTPGMVGPALRFNGSSSFFELPADTPGLKVGDKDFTIEAWVRTSDAKFSRNVFDHRSNDPVGYLLYVRAGNPAFQVADGSSVSDVIAANISIADGKWHHVAAVVKRLPPQPASIYVDGVLRAQSGKSVSFGNLDHDEPAWLGRHRRNGYVKRDNMYYNGDLDELAVYRRALDGAEIRRIFLAGAKGKCQSRRR
jgi:Concanavalin A-like lectin/glucanases superfamily